LRALRSEAQTLQLDQSCGYTQGVLQPIAADQAPVLQQLFELYCYDFSEQLRLPLKASGRFEISVGDWWTREGHFPFFIQRNDELLGFALARRGSQLSGAANVMDVAEFFVVRSARRAGIGGDAARELFERFPGPWEIRVRESNVSALAFWSRVVSARHAERTLPEPFERDGVPWRLLRVR
jgi:predicted acetyltransferase